MPTRYLKPGIRDSDHIEAITDPDAEVMYYRLLVSVDDFGRADARPLMLKSLCFPIRVRATADKCMRWAQDLAKAGLLKLYEVDGKFYLQLTKWDNKPRAEHSKYPNPPTDADKCMQMLPVTVTVTDNREPIKALSGKPDLKPLAIETLNFLNAKTGHAYKPVDSNLRLITSLLKQGFTPDDIRAVIVSKCRQWSGDPKMADYLRPITLFRASNFANYEGQLAQVSDGN